MRKIKYKWSERNWSAAEKIKCEWCRQAFESFVKNKVTKTASYFQKWNDLIMRKSETEHLIICMKILTLKSMNIKIKRSENTRK